MAPKNPLGTIKDVADLAVASVVGTVSRTVKDPVGTGKKVVGTAVGQAAAAVGAVTSKVGGRTGSEGPDQGGPREAGGRRSSRRRPRRKPPAKKAPTKKTAAKKAPAKKRRRQEDRRQEGPPPRRPPPRRPAAPHREPRAEMDPRTILTRGVSTGLRLGRGTADRVVTIAGPPLGRLSDKMVSRMRRPERRSPATFTPSKRSDVADGRARRRHREAARHRPPWPATSARRDRPRSRPAAPRRRASPARSSHLRGPARPSTAQVRP